MTEVVKYAEDPAQNQRKGEADCSLYTLLVLDKVEAEVLVVESDTNSGNQNVADTEGSGNQLY